MGLKTRLDGRSEENSSFEIKDAEGKVLANVKIADQSGVTLDVSTSEGCFIEKPNGWKSQK